MAFKSLFAIQLVVKGRGFIAGKIVQHGEQKVFFRTPAKDAVLHLTDSLSIDARLPTFLETQGVTELHIEDGGKLYTVKLDVFKTWAGLGNHGDGDQLYLPRRLWHVRKTYKPTFTTDVRPCS